MSLPAQTSCNVYTPDLLESGDVVTLGGGAGPTSGTPSSPNAFRASPSPSVRGSLAAAPTRQRFLDREPLRNNDAGAAVPDDAAVSEAGETTTDVAEAGEATQRPQP